MKDYKQLLNEIKEDKTRKLRPCKIAILSSYTIKNISDALMYKLYSAGFEPELKYGGYNQFIQELMDKSSWIYEFKPDVILIALNSKTYLEDLEFNVLDKNTKEIESFIKEKVDFINMAISSEDIKAKVIITNLDHFMHSPYGLIDIGREDGLHSAVEIFNKGLIEIKRKKKNVEILNFEKLCSIHGKKNIFDEKMFFLGKILLSKLGVEVMAEEIVLFVNAMFGNNRKVLVVDLDNTLWKGVIGEDGPHGIIIGEGAVGEIYKEVQSIILNYKKLGTLIAITSKNNEKDALEAFSLNKNMVLKENDFIVKKINWQPKSVSIKEIASELNLGLDSFVFLDDNPAERLEVKSALPMVEVIDFPEDITYLPSLLREMPYFRPLSITEEDKKRHEMYSQDIARNELKEGGSIDDYLAKLNTQITIKKNDFDSIDRITQLTNKTNQFNLRTIRYTLEQMKAMMSDKNTTVYSLSVKDKFGELGLTGVAIVKKDKDSYFFDSLLLSCRILSRKIEEQFFYEITRDMDKKLTLKAEYIPSPKNEQVKEFYDKLGLELESETNGVRKYSKPLKDINSLDIKSIKVLR